MNKTLRISFSLKNTYRVNSILFGLKQIPLIKEVLPLSLYRASGIKIAANILTVIWEVITAFLGKFLFFLLGIWLAVELYETKESGTLFFHLFVCLTMLGAFGNTYVFNPSRDKYYALILMRMNAKEYTLIHYAYFLLKLFVGYTVFGLIFGLSCGLSVWECFLFPFSVVGMKSVMIAWSLRDFKRTGKAANENKLEKWYWIAIVLLLAAAYGLPVVEIMLPRTVSIFVLVIFVVAGLISAKSIVVFDEYYEIQRQILVDLMLDFKMSSDIVQEQSRNMISVDTKISSGRRGYEYLNELFVKRHRKILWRSSKRIAAIILIGAVAASAALWFHPQVGDGVNGLIMEFLPYFVFIMYSINRGAGFTRALFVNCDRCLLTYAFYKQPKHILKLFAIRLRELIKINLLPAFVLAVSLDVLLYISGGTDIFTNYLIVFVSIIAMSIFFSVHYLTIYYLLQPYNADTEVKSGMYQIIMTATYVICYVFIHIKMQLVLFGITAIVFCVAYCVIACTLVYRMAPKTFRMRQ